MFLSYVISGQRVKVLISVAISLPFVVDYLLGDDKINMVVRSKSWFGCMDCGVIQSGQPDVIGPGVNYNKFDAH